MNKINILKKTLDQAQILSPEKTLDIFYSSKYNNAWQRFCILIDNTTRKCCQKSTHLKQGLDGIQNNYFSMDQTIPQFFQPLSQIIICVKNKVNK